MQDYPEPSHHKHMREFKVIQTSQKKKKHDDITMFLHFLLSFFFLLKRQSYELRAQYNAMREKVVTVRSPQCPQTPRGSILVPWLTMPSSQ